MSAGRIELPDGIRSAPEPANPETLWTLSAKSVNVQPKLMGEESGCRTGCTGLFREWFVLVETSASMHQEYWRAL